MRAVLLSLFLALIVATPAAALTQDEARKCAVMQRTFDAKIAEVETLKVQRAEAAATAEAAGEAWENAEALRNFGDAEAAEANGMRDTFNAAKRAFNGKDAALRSATEMLNRDIAEYNRACTPNQ